MQNRSAGRIVKKYLHPAAGRIDTAKEVHSILVQGVRREEFEATKKAFLTECIRSGSLAHPNVVLFLGVYNPGGQSLLPVLVMERMQESLTSVVEKYPNIPMYVKLSMFNIGCVSRIVVPPCSSSSHRSSRPLTKQCTVE